MARKSKYLEYLCGSTWNMNCFFICQCLLSSTNLFHLTLEQAKPKNEKWGSDLRAGTRKDS